MTNATHEMSFTEAIADLGADRSLITPQHWRSLETDGFAVVEGLIDPGWLFELRARFDRLIAEEGASAGSEHVPEAGTDRLCDLVNKGAVFDRVWTHPAVLAAFHHIIGRAFKFSSLNGRDVLKGQGVQDIHADWWQTREAGVHHTVNAIWVLDDFTADNGATRVIPGSHRSVLRPPEVLADTKATHPDEVLVRCTAGSVVLMNGHLWHGGTRNNSGARRRVFHAYYCAREHGQQIDQRRYIRPETSARLSPAARYLLDA
ncbi:MAG: phytanoyl-CoA dioxygenase family protein [Planctomycetes bacterium]|nr:phytanoyl-CoA dioxygenase family protein [Planctomycetota bacterium]